MLEPAMKTETPPLNGGRLVLAVAIYLAIALLEGFDIVAISIAAPELMRDLHLLQSQTGQVFAGGQAGLVLGAVLGGVAGDRLGRRNALLAGVICFGLFCTLTTLAFDFTSLMAARSLTGIGIGIVMPNLISLAVESAPAKHRGKIVASTLAGVPAGGAAVAVFASFFLPTLGWQSLFYVGGLLPLAIAPLILILPNLRSARKRASSTKRSWAESLFGKGRGLTTFLLWSVLFLTATVLYMMVNWLPSLMTARGFTLEVSHYSSAMFSMGGCVGTLTFGVLIDRFGYRRVLVPAYVGILAAMCGIAFTETAGVILISAGILGFFVTGSFYTLNGASPLYYPAESRGLGTGAAVGFGRVGSIVGPLIAGYVFQIGVGPIAAGPSAVPLATIPLVILGGITAWLVSRRPRVLEVDPHRHA
jgi:AAHS family 3-hydroxyphenylpropionic acid transporter